MIRKTIFVVCCVLFFDPSMAQQLFTRILPEESGLHFTNVLTETSDFNTISYEYLYNGSGVAIGDINNDGLSDIFFASNLMPNKLFLNEGHLKFKDISIPSGIEDGFGFHTGVTMVDINNDGFLDIYVCKSAAAIPNERRNDLFINNGDLTFTNKAKEYGLDDPSFHTQAYFNDMDLDGDVDLFLLNHPREMKQANNVTLAYNNKGKLVAVVDTQRTYVSCRYYENANGKYLDKTIKAGLGTYAFGLSAVIDDFNNDGFPDIYTCNDYHQPDYLYINNKNGTYTNQFSKYFNHTSYSSMGSDYADINNDGLPDLVVLDMLTESLIRQKELKGPGNYDTHNKRVEYGLGYQYVKNVLQLNNGNGSYSDISYMAGVAFTDWSWAPLLNDFDNDGLKDLYISNGYLRDVTNMDFAVFRADSIRKALFKAKSEEEAMALLSDIPSTKIQNYFFHNNGDLTFKNETTTSGLNDPSWSNGAAYGDLDNDGDLEIVVNNLNQEAFLFKNNSIENNKGKYIRFQFNGPAKNKGGLWTKVEIETPDGVKQHQRFFPTRGFMSCHESFLHFGTGQNETVQVKVTWPDKKFQILKNIPCNAVYTLKYTDALEKDSIPPPISAQLFKDITTETKIDYTQTESGYIDFKLEPLLPHQFSRMGPCIAIADVNKDQLEDIYIGGSKDISGVIYIQDKYGKFKVLNQSFFDADRKYEDTGSQFFDADGDGDQDLLVISGGNETPGDTTLYIQRLYLNNGSGNFTRSRSFPSIQVSGQAVAIDDYNKDGSPDIFIGGRVVPGHYGIIPPSFLLNNDKGIFTDVTSQTPQLQFAGMITDAKWLDTDNDGWKDLVIAGEWMPITIFKNKDGNLSTVPVEIAGTNGWWNTIESADIDNDGDQDLIAGNVGLNTRYQGDEKNPVTMIVCDFDKNGSTDCIISVYENGVSYPLVLRDNLLDQMNYLKKKYLRYKDYSTATINDIFTKEQLDGAKHFQASRMTSTQFINDGKGNFTIQDLPVVAQLAPVNGILTEDINKDGKPDLLLVGNNYSTEVETGRNDAGIGMVLQNAGNNNYKMIPVTSSGFYVPGDVKCLKKITIAGKPCIIAGKNSGKIQVLGYY